VGLAYRLGDKTVVRAGYGMNYDPIPFSRPMRGRYPLTINFVNSAPNTFAWASTLEQGVPNTVGPDLSTGIVQLPGNANSIAGFAHTAFEHIPNAQLAPDLPDVDSLAFVGKSGLSRDDEQRFGP